MKDVRFYLEFPDSTTKHKSGKANVGHEGNVFAAFVGYGAQNRGTTGDAQWDGLGAVYFYPDSPVASTSASIYGHIQAKCKRIPESLARTIHPNLFHRLDDAS